MAAKGILNSKLMMLVLLVRIYVKAYPTGEFHFSKLGSRWPASYCNSYKIWRRPCMKPIFHDFVIHGFWPMYSDEESWKANIESFVPPYNETGCSLIKPATQDVIQESFFDETLPLRRTVLNWPNIFNYSSTIANLDLWRTQWRLHGMCSGNSPFLYLKTPIDYITKYNFREILAKGDIIPNNSYYRLAHVIQTVEGEIGVRPQIRCGKDTYNRALQLAEIMICFDKLNAAKSCNYLTYECPGTNINLIRIKFPAITI